MQQQSLKTVLAKQTLLPFMIPAAFIALGVAGGFAFALVADAGGWPAALGALIAGAVGGLAVGVLFWSSDRTVVFNAANSQVEVYRNRLAKTPLVAYPASGFQAVRISKVRVRSLLLSRAELISSKESLQMITHRDNNKVEAVAAAASRLLGLPVDNQKINPGNLLP